MLPAALALLTSFAAQSGCGDLAPPTCDQDTLTFCDEGADAPVTLDCTSLGMTCGALSAEWGDDCLLPAGAECDPGYAFGASRCAPPLGCVDGACASGPTDGEEPVSPTAGSTPVADDTTSTSSDLLSCLGCSNSSAAAFLLFLPVLRLPRLQRRRRGRAG